MAGLVRYRTLVYDSARWADFRLRPDDIVVCTPPKAGTTWTQYLCAMLVLDTTELDRPLAEISPWLDMVTTAQDDVFSSLEAQRHRRIIKTHTPLDGVPVLDGVSYVCVGRDPRDTALSFQHHWANLDLGAVMAAREAAVGLEDLVELGPPPALPDDPRLQLRAWIEADAGAPFIGQTLGDVLHHLTTFWERRHQPNVALFHYADLQRDLPAQIRRLAAFLRIELTDDRLERFAAAGSFDAMRARADQLVPDRRNGIWRSNADFFHRGSSGQWLGLLDDEGLRRYEERVAGLVPPDLAAWMHSGQSPSVAQPALT